MERTSYTARDFVPVVKDEMARRDKFGRRTLARRCAEFDGKNSEVWRRNVYRWLDEGVRPSRENRRIVAQALGLPHDIFDVEDEEEEPGLDPVHTLVRSLELIVRNTVRAEGEPGTRSLRGLAPSPGFLKNWERA